MVEWGTEMKICKNCRYFDDIWCIHPNNGMSPVTGTIPKRFAVINRDSKSVLYDGVVCGPDGDWFEEKIHFIKKKWWKIW